MRVFEDAWQRDDLPRGGVVTIGNFDGLHRGQSELIAQVRERARASGQHALVVTFEPHPKKVLRPESAPPCLTTGSQKLRLLEAADVDAVAVIDFDTEFSETTAAAFVTDFLVGRLAAVEVYVGSSFTFGRGREGTLEFLIERGARDGFVAVGVPEVVHDGEAISSTRIRHLIAAGEVEEAAELLGRTYSVAGRVEPGEARGRDLGWPTANLAVDNELYPKDGVYATQAWLEDDDQGRMSVTNVGTRPTFGATEARLIECHLLDFEADLYGRPLELRFCRRLRGERRFGSSDELVEQIARDVQETREYFATLAC